MKQPQPLTLQRPPVELGDPVTQRLPTLVRLDRDKGIREDVRAGPVLALAVLVAKLQAGLDRNLAREPVK